jgi:hypothetical protein
VVNLVGHGYHGMQQPFECLVGILIAAEMIVLKILWQPWFS